MIQSVRGVLKGAAELVLVGSGAASRARKRNAHRVSVLAYHDVVAAGDVGRGDVSLHLGIDDFRRQMDRLEETHRVVALEALEGGAAPAGGFDDPGAHAPPDGEARPAAALTFDDAYRGALRHAVPELVRRGLPATVFVCPALLGEEGFWWDRVADTPSGPGPARRAEALGRLGGRHHAVLEVFGGGPVPDDYRPATAEEVRALAREPGITVASHTWSHPDLTAVDGAELLDELARPREWLAAELGASFLPGHLTFPYGRWDEGVAAAARDAGYRFLWRVEGGLARPGAGGGVLPRVNVPAGVSRRGFELRAAGALG